MNGNKEFRYFGPIISRKQLAILYNASAAKFNRMIQDLVGEIGFEEGTKNIRTFSPKQINTIFKEYGIPKLDSIKGAKVEYL